MTAVDHISGHFRSIWIFFKLFLQNGRRHFNRISCHFRSIRNFFFWIFFTKWPPAPISDVRNSFLITFLQLYFVGKFLTAVDHFGCPKFTFDSISGHFRSIRNFILFLNFFTKWPPADILDAFLAISDRSAILDV